MFSKSFFRNTFRPMAWLHWSLFLARPNGAAPWHGRVVYEAGSPQPGAPLLNPGPLVDIAHPLPKAARVPRAVSVPWGPPHHEKLFKLHRVAEDMLRVARARGQERPLDE